MVTKYTPSSPGAMDKQVYRELQRISMTLNEMQGEEDAEDTYLPLAGGTLTGDLTIDRAGDADHAQIIFDADSGSQQRLLFTDSGDTTRVVLGLDKADDTVLVGAANLDTDVRATSSMDFTIGGTVKATLAGTLELFNASSSATGLRINQASGTDYADLYMNSGDFVINRNATGGYDFAIDSSGDTNVTNNLNVGVNIDVAGSGSLTNPSLQFTAHNATGEGIDTTASGVMRLIMNSTALLQLDEPNGTATLAQDINITDGTSGWFFPVSGVATGYRPNNTAAGNTLRLYTDVYATNGEVLQIKNSGNVNNYNNSYGSLSDVRLKENITDVSPQLSDLLQLRIVHFNRIDDPTKRKQVGLIAQEVEQVKPGLVEEGEGGYKGVKYSLLTPMLVKSVQEIVAHAQVLKGRVDTLEATVQTQQDALLGQQQTIADLMARIEALEAAA